VVVAGGRLWVLSGHQLGWFDPASTTLTTALAPGFPHLAADDSSVWVVGGLSRTVIRRLDPASLDQLAETMGPWSPRVAARSGISPSPSRRMRCGSAPRATADR